MKHVDQLMKHNLVLTALHNLPKKIVSLHEWDNTPAFVLHDFCHENCFNFSKAAYFVDNPDFNCVKGVAGVCPHEEGYCKDIKDVWEQPSQFADYLDKSPFHTKVRAIEEHSVVHNGSQEELVSKLAADLEIKKPGYFTWNMKHGNHGLLVYEKGEAEPEWHDEHVQNGVYLLSFCPIN